MRCQYCGSTMLHPDTQHKQFATGKAVAGAITFGMVGAAAGFIGKDTKGHRCGACGAFMEKPMDFSTEMSIDNAIREAEVGRSRSLFDYFKKQYPNIEANIPTATVAAVPTPAVRQAIPVEIKAAEPTLKRICPPPAWQADCPVYVDTVMIKTSDQGDVLSLKAYNQSGKELRSVYYKAIAYDDTGDKLSEISCVFQGINVPAGQILPIDKSFSLETDLAYRVELVCEKAAFAGDEVWRGGDGHGVELPIKAQLTHDSFPHIKYLRSELKNKCNLTDDADLYLPQEGEGYWRCICGQPVQSGKKCPRCGAEIESIRPLLSQQYLREVQLATVKQRAAERAKITSTLYERVHSQDLETTYATASSLVNSDSPSTLGTAIESLSRISGYKDSAELIEVCKKRIKEIEAAEKEQVERTAKEKAEEERISAENEAKRKSKNKKIGIFAGVAAVFVVAVALVATQIIIPSNKYKAAEALLNAGEYDAAVEAFSALGSYKNAAEMISEVYYSQGSALVDAGNDAGAAIAFGKAGNYKDARDKSFEIWDKCAQRESISSGHDMFARVDPDGTVMTFGSHSLIGGDTSDWTDIVAVSVGYEHVVGLRADGTVNAAGYSSWHKGVNEWTDIVAISAGAYHTVGLRKDGTVVAVGVSDDGALDVSQWKDIMAISAGTNYTVGLQADGTVIAVGRNDKLQCDVSGWKNIIAISAGDDHTVGLKKDGTVIATASNYNGRCDVFGWTDIVAISAGHYHTVGLRKDGTVVAAGKETDKRVDVSSWTDIKAISAGVNDTYGLKTDGSVVYTGK